MDDVYARNEREVHTTFFQETQSFSLAVAKLFRELATAPRDANEPGSSPSQTSCCSRRVFFVDVWLSSIKRATSSATAATDRLRVASSEARRPQRAPGPAVPRSRDSDRPTARPRDANT